MDSKTVPLRVSCSGIVAFRIEDSFLGTLNRSRLAAGQIVYTPPGGAYKYIGRKTQDYLRSIGATVGDDNELRFLLNGTENERSLTLQRFHRWFCGRKKREKRHSREIYEELFGQGSEEQFLQLNVMPRLYRHSPDMVFFRDITTRPDGEHYLTQYYIELFDARMIHRFQKIITQRLKKQRTSHVHLLSLEEITQGRTNEQLRIEETYAPVEISRLFLYFL